MKQCPSCYGERGHYSTVTYKPIDDPKKSVIEAYWFCHECAMLVYGTDFAPYMNKEE